MFMSKLMAWLITLGFALASVGALGKRHSILLRKQHSLVNMSNLASQNGVER